MKHTAFEELNHGIVSLYYQEEQIKRFGGFRILGVDSTKLTLPNSLEIAKEFGQIPIGNQTKEKLGKYSQGLFLCYYDVLNHLAVHSILEKGNAYEVDLASQLLDKTQKDDLLIYDRGFASYRFFAELMNLNKNFIVRCPQNFLLETQQMFKPGGPDDIQVTLKVPKAKSKEIKALNLLDEINIRLVRVILKTGEIEVLATSLMDNLLFPTAMFRELYFLRWGMEGFYSKIKGRLALENFTGKTVEAIKQDLWSTLFLSNLEAMLTEELDEQLQNKASAKGQRKKSINKAVSFNAIKNMAFELISKDKEDDWVLDQLTQLFLTNTISARPEREVPRHKISDTRSMNYQKKARKHVF